MIILLMGVAGSGKTTVGRRLATVLGWSFRDADEFHPLANIVKMSAGRPLDDADRVPWLAAIREYIAACLAHGEDAVVTCSALKESHRQVLIVDPAQVKLVFLDGSLPLLEQRLRERPGHFMKPAMLPSQLAALEPPAAALKLDITESPDALVAKIRHAFLP
jgi:gluconokinase